MTDWQSQPGAISLLFRHPPEAFLYQATKPRLRVDGVDVPVSGWGRHEIPVPAGVHKVQIWVPYVFPRKAGRAQTEVTVNSGEKTELEYLAPTFTFAGGSLGTPGGQRSTGRSTVRTLNLITIVVLAIVAAVYLLR